MIFPSSAFSENAQLKSSVQSLKDEGDKLFAKELQSEAFEKYKDSVCLAELQKWPDEKLRALLFELARKTDAQHRTFRMNDYFRKKYFDVTPITTEKDFLQIRSELKKAQLGHDFDRPELIEKIGKQISAMKCDSREARIAQIEVLSDLSIGTNHSRIVRPFLERAVELSSELNPPDSTSQAHALERYFAHFVFNNQKQINPSDARFLRKALDMSFDLLQKDKNVSLQVDNGLQKLMTVEDISSLIPLFEKNYQRMKSLTGDPEYYSSEYCGLGWAYMAAEKYQDAERIFKEVMKLTSRNRFAEPQYEFAQLSLARCYLLQKKFAPAKSTLRSLRTFLVSPHRADIRQYGAMAEAMLGEIYMQENNWAAARASLEHADEALSISDSRIHLKLRDATFVKNQIPSDESVLEQLVKVYSKLDLDYKVEQTKISLNDVRRTKPTSSGLLSNSLKNASMSAPRWLFSKAASDVAAYREFILSSVKDEKALAKELNELERVCINRGLISEGEQCVDAASKLKLQDDKSLHQELLRNQAWLLILKRDYEQARSILIGILSDNSHSDERSLDEWLIAKILLEEGKTSDAVDSLEKLIASWKPKEEHLQYFNECNCDLASALISQKKYPQAESLLKNYVVKGPRARYGEIVVSPWMYGLLAYSEALQNKRAESEFNLRASFETRQPQRHGLLAANTMKNVAGTYEALGDIDRARRFYYEALQEFEPTLSSSHPEVVSLRQKIAELTPVHAI